LSKNGPARGERAKEYVDLSSPLDAALGHFRQIPKGRRNGFHLEPVCACKGSQPSRRASRPDMFAIPAPRRRQ
jgi:hypothetical protein